jgi:hypothetical protein
VTPGFILALFGIICICGATKVGNADFLYLSTSHSNNPMVQNCMYPRFFPPDPAVYPFCGQGVPAAKRESKMASSTENSNCYWYNSKDSCGWLDSWQETDMR